MNANRNWKTEVLSEIGTFSRWAVSAALDAAFLVFWVFVQRAADVYTRDPSLSGIEQLQLTTFKLLFAITTLAPIAAYVVVDVVRIYLQARRMIILEKQQIDLDIGGQ